MKKPLSVVLLCVLGGLLSTSRASAVTVTDTFSFTGSAQTFDVPAGVTSVEIDAQGAQGSAAQDGTAAGNGGRSLATISVTPSEQLQINVGGQPTTGNPAPGGFNGGGPGGTASGPGALNGGGGGGGASDVRQGGTALADRIVIAGGGGGGGGSAGPCTGGSGGGATGGAGSPCSSLEGGGGTQSAGGGAGASGGAAGLTGIGGSGGDENFGGHSGAGGGGGLFGGGGSSGDSVSVSGGGGGGGSGFTPGGTGMTNDFRAGNGIVTITYSIPPDALIRIGSDPFVGDDINDDGSGQVVTAKVKKGQTATFDLMFENDAPVSDTFTIDGCNLNPRRKGFRHRYLAGPVDVTQAVVDGTFQTPPLAPGGNATLTLEIKVLKRGLDKPRTCRTTAISNDDASEDTVSARLKPN